VSVGQEVNVVLRKQGKLWVVERVVGFAPQDEVYIKGRVKSLDSFDQRVNEPRPLRGIALPEPVEFGRSFPKVETLEIEYGIGDYFIPENAGRGVVFGGKDMVARVKVDDKGRAVLTQIFMDGKPWP